MKKAFIAIFVAILTLTIVSIAHAGSGESRCQAIYGGGEVCTKNIEFSIQKLVKKPGKGGGNFVDTLQSNDPKYSPNQTVDFKIIIKNTGEEKIDEARITDTLPQYLTFLSGVGNYDANTRNLTYTVKDLDPNETVEHVFTTRIVEEKFLPTDQGVVCVINNVEAVENNGAIAQDSAQVCIEKQILGTDTKGGLKVFDEVPLKKTPATGPSLFYLLALIPTGIAGFIFRIKSRIS